MLPNVLDDIMIPLTSFQDVLVSVSANTWPSVHYITSSTFFSSNILQKNLIFPVSLSFTHFLKVLLHSDEASQFALIFLLLKK